MCPVLFGDLCGTHRQVSRFDAPGARPGRNPLGEDGDLSGGQFFIAWRHFAGAHLLDQKTFCRVTRNNGRSGLASAHQGPAQAEVKSAFQFLPFTVAVETMRLEDGAHMLFEGELPGGNLLGGGAKGEHQDQEGERTQRDHRRAVCRPMESPGQHAIRNCF